MGLHCFSSREYMYYRSVPSVILCLALLLQVITEGSMEKVLLTCYHPQSPSNIRLGESKNSSEWFCKDLCYKEQDMGVKD